MRKVHPGIQTPANERVPGELLAIVKGQGLAGLSVGTQ